MKRQWNNDRNESRLQSFLEVKKYRGGIHGLSHAQRVEKFGLMLAEKTDADRDVIIWFAYLHDSQRTDDGFDFNHGPDAARFIDTIRKSFLQELSDTQISKLKEACRLHTSTHRTWDITIDTCFDADRLDLPRVGIMPDPKRMATEQGAQYADRGCYNDFKEAGSNDNTNGCSKYHKGLVFHDQVINTGKGKSKFAVRFNEKTDDGKSIGPFTYSRGKLYYSEWDLSAKSVSEDDCIRSYHVSDGAGIYAVEFDTFLSGKGYAAEEMMKNENVTLILLEYTDDDIVAKSENEICLRQCNIVYVSEQSTFIAKCKAGTINKLMAQFIVDKEAAEYNTYAKPVRDISVGLSRFMMEFNISKPMVEFALGHISALNIFEALQMPRSIIHWGLAIKCSKLDSMKLCKPFFILARNKYLNELYDEEIEMLKSIYDENAYDELNKARLAAFNDAFVASNYLFTGKGESKTLVYKFSKVLFNLVNVSLRKELEELYPESFINKVNKTNIPNTTSVLFEWQIT